MNETSRRTGILKLNFNLPRAELILFLTLAAAGFVGALLTYHLLDGHAYNFSPNLIGVFIAPFFCSIYLALIAWQKPLTTNYLWKMLTLYGIQSIPFAFLFFQIFEPMPGEDFERYCTYAKNMIDHGTLWGGDSLVFPRTGKHYMTQPGYRYIIALEWIAFGKLYRIISFINIAICLTGIFYFQKAIQQVVNDRRIKFMLLALVVLITPYFIKNSLMGLPEWISMVLLIIATYSYVIKKNEFAAIALLAFIPFFRQNLLFTMLLIAGLIIAGSVRKLPLIACFLIVILLPVYHNLYYAGELRFFVDIFNYPFLNYDAADQPTDLRPSFLVHNILHYFGFEHYRGAYHFAPIAVFIFLADFLYFYLLASIPGRRQKMTYFILTACAIGPALFLGGGYYPRFEFVNSIVMIVSFLLVSAGFMKAKTLS